MQNLQDIFNRLEEAKQEQKEIKASYRDALTHSQAHQEVVEELKTLKEKKKEIESAIRADFGPEFDRLDELKEQIADDKQLLADIALNQYVNGERVEIYDKNETQYEPVFSVKFRKAK